MAWWVFRRSLRMCAGTFASQSLLHSAGSRSDELGLGPVQLWAPGAGLQVLLMRLVQSADVGVLPGCFLPLVIFVLWSLLNGKESFACSLEALVSQAGKWSSGRQIWKAALIRSGAANYCILLILCRLVLFIGLWWVMIFYTFCIKSR